MLPFTQLWQAYILLAVLAIAFTYLLISKLSKRMKVVTLLAVCLCILNWMFIAALWLKIMITIYLIFLVWITYEIQIAPCIKEPEEDQSIPWGEVRP